MSISLKNLQERRIPYRKQEVEYKRTNDSAKSTCGKFQYFISILQLIIQKKEDVIMDLMNERCAGLDVHEAVIVGCCITGELGQKPEKEIREFGTTTRELIELLDWLEEKEISHVAMESTGVYWIPVWNILEAGNYEMLLANAKAIKNLPGRKTDIKDSEWICQLLRAGLVPRSYIPEEGIRNLRETTRYAKKLLQQISGEKNRVYKLLESCNIKLTQVLSDIFGDSGRQIIERIISGREVTRALLEETILIGRGKGQLKKKVEEILYTLDGKVSEHSRFLLQMQYENILYLEHQYRKLEEQIERESQQYSEEIGLLSTIPGISTKGATTIIAEIGADMNQFANSKQLCAWAGMSPGNNESARKKKRSKTQPGNKYLKSTLCELAWAAKNKKNSRMNRSYYSYITRMGSKKAIIAVAHMLLRLCYKMLLDKTTYKEMDNEYIKNKENTRQKRYINYLISQGYSIQKNI